MAEPRQPFDPLGLLATLERHGVTYVLVGQFARVLRGTDEIADGIELAPSLRPENLRRLKAAVGDLDPHGGDDRVLALEPGARIEFSTELGEVAVVATPAGTAGYDDLRRAASHEPLGSGLRPAVASTGDLARTLAAGGREDDVPQLLALRRLAELDRQLGRDL